MAVTTYTSMKMVMSKKQMCVLCTNIIGICCTGGLSAAEKYIIKSRLGLIYWRAEEKPAWICTQHRYSSTVQVQELSTGTVAQYKYSSTVQVQ